MIISIASGKGGTGKTTVATNMAVSIETGVQILDCDVEEPNAHLFLNPIIEKQKRTNGSRPGNGRRKRILRQCKKRSLRRSRK
jgi:MinD superfamily P-loop ATPase